MRDTTAGDPLSTLRMPYSELTAGGGGLRLRAGMVRAADYLVSVRALRRQREEENISTTLPRKKTSGKMVWSKAQFNGPTNNFS